MEVPVDASLVSTIRTQLVEQNAKHMAFEGIIRDYASCLQRCRELQVRSSQLDKEAGELRSQNEELHMVAVDTKQAAVRSEEYAALEARAQQLQTELTTAYRERAQRADESLQATRQLQVVRDINERQGRELGEAAEEIHRLKGEIKELRSQVDRYRESHAVVTAEMETRLAEAQAATSAVAGLEADNAELVRRLMDFKAAEMERMNDMNRMRDEVLASAKQQAAAMLAEARTRALATGRLSQGAEVLNESIRTLGALGLQGAAGAERGDTLPGSVLRSVPSHDGGCFGLAFDRLGSKLASCGADRTVKIWDPATATVTATLHGAFEGLNGVCFTSDTRLVLGADSRQAVRVWDLASARLKLSLTGHVGKVTSVDCSAADPQTVVSCGADRTIKVWGLERGYCTRTLMCTSTPHSLALTQDGYVVVSGHFDGTLRFWDLRSGRLAHEVAGLHTQQITSVATGLMGGLVLTCGKDNLLRTVDVRSFEVRQTLAAPGFSVGGPWVAAALSPSEKWAAAGSVEGSVFVWDLEKRSVAAKLRSPKLVSAVSGCCWSPTGVPLASCDKAGVVTIWQASAQGG